MARLFPVLAAALLATAVPAAAQTPAPQIAGLVDFVDGVMA